MNDFVDADDLAEGIGGFSDEFQDFISLCLVKDPSERPSSSEMLNHPFVRGVDVDGGNGTGEDLEGDGSDTARGELEDITCAVVDYYKKLWVVQSENDIGLTVPNFHKSKLKRLGNQIGLGNGIVQRKMKSVLKRLKQELVSSGMGENMSRENKEVGEGSFYSSRSTNVSNSGGVR